MSPNESQLPLWLAILSLSEQATRDWLTGLHNRRYFEEALADQLAIANRYSRPLSLILFDIDHFKQINDTHGHEAGDQLLRTFAELLRNSIREADIAARYGGDEFVVLLPETDLTNARILAERIRQLATDFSVTAGLAALPSENLVATADADLLAQKRAGTPLAH